MMIDFATLELATSPNQYLVCAAELCQAEANRAPPSFDVPAVSLREAWFQVVSEEPRVRLVESDDDLLQYAFVQRSAVFRFPDRITVRFLPLADGRSTLAVYSRSIYGYSDLGVNRRRVERWLTALGETVGPGSQP